MLHVIRVERERDTGMRMSVDGMEHARLVRLVQRVVVNICIEVGIVGYRGSSGGRYMRREIGRTVSVLFANEYCRLWGGKKQKAGARTASSCLRLRKFMAIMRHVRFSMRS